MAQVHARAVCSVCLGRNHFGGMPDKWDGFDGMDPQNVGVQHKVLAR